MPDNYNNTPGFTDSGHGIVAQPGVVGDDNDFEGWDWKQIMASIVGSAASTDMSNVASVADPSSLTKAAQTFLNVQMTLQMVTTALREQATAIAGDNGPWKGPAADSFTTKMETYSRDINAQAQRLSGGNTALNSFPISLQTNSAELALAQYRIRQIDAWYADQAVRLGANVANGLVQVSSKPEVVTMMTNDMKSVLRALSGRYHTTLDAIRAPAPVDPDLGNTDLNNINAPDPPGGAGGDPPPVPDPAGIDPPPVSNLPGGGSDATAIPAPDSLKGLGGDGTPDPSGVGGLDGLGGAGGVPDAFGGGGLDGLGGAGGAPDAFGGGGLDGLGNAPGGSGLAGLGDVPGGSGIDGAGGGGVAAPFPGAGLGAGAGDAPSGATVGGTNGALSAAPFTDPAAGLGGAGLGDGGLSGAGLGGGIGSGAAQPFPGDLSAGDLGAAGSGGLDALSPASLASPGPGFDPSLGSAGGATGLGSSGMPMMPPMGGAGGGAGAQGGTEPPDAAGLVARSVEPFTGDTALPSAMTGGAPAAFPDTGLGGAGLDSAAPNPADAALAGDPALLGSAPLGSAAGGMPMMPPMGGAGGGAGAQGGTEPPDSAGLVARSGEPFTGDGSLGLGEMTAGATPVPGADLGAERMGAALDPGAAVLAGAGGMPMMPPMGGMGGGAGAQGGTEPPDSAGLVARSGEPFTGDGSLGLGEMTGGASPEPSTGALDPGAAVSAGAGGMPMMPPMGGGAGNTTGAQGGTEPPDSAGLVARSEEPFTADGSLDTAPMTGGALPAGDLDDEGVEQTNEQLGTGQHPPASGGAGVPFLPGVGGAAGTAAAAGARPRPDAEAMVARSVEVFGDSPTQVGAVGTPAGPTAGLAPRGSGPGRRPGPPTGERTGAATAVPEGPAADDATAWDVPGLDGVWWAVAPVVRGGEEPARQKQARSAWRPEDTPPPPEPVVMSCADDDSIFPEDEPVEDEPEPPQPGAGEDDEEPERTAADLLTGSRSWWDDVGAPGQSSALDRA